MCFFQIQYCKLILNICASFIKLSTTSRWRQTNTMTAKGITAKEEETSCVTSPFKTILKFSFSQFGVAFALKMSQNTPDKDSQTSGAKKTISLPISRVRLIMKSSPDVSSINQDALFLTTKATVS